MTRQLPSTAPRTLHTVEFTDTYPGNDPEKVADLAEANLVSSIDPDSDPGSPDAKHRPVLDIDFPAALVPSSTPGHFHLYLDVEIDDEAYWPMLSALADAGILQPGYVRACQARGFTSVRLPWVKKVGANS